MRDPVLIDLLEDVVHRLHHLSRREQIAHIEHIARQLPGVEAVVTHAVEAGHVEAAERYHRAALRRLQLVALADETHVRRMALQAAREALGSLTEQVRGMELVDRLDGL